MITIYTEHLYGKTEMNVVDGVLLPSYDNTNKGVTIVSILNIKRSTGMESGFLFFDKNTNIEICHVGITFKRGRFEVSYGTNDGFKNQGYMSEALHSVVEWVFTNTKQDEIWALPNGCISERVLKKCGFYSCGEYKENKGMSWYKIKTNS